MEPSPSIIFTCDTLVEFEENAARFGQGEPELVNGATPAAAAESAPAAADSSPPPVTSDQKPNA